ncbi:MAG: calcium/sodium antiporter [Candidatus Eutrophobiaceae bacterium]
MRLPFGVAGKHGSFSVGYNALAMWLSILFIPLGCALLAFGADRVVSGAVSLSRILGMPALYVGVFVVGLATSLPEILVSVRAAIQGNTELAVGNALGSNIANIALVIGTCALFAPFAVSSHLIRREYMLMLLFSVLGFVLLGNFYLSRLDGTLLLLSLGIYLYALFRIVGNADESDPLCNNAEREFHQVDESLAKATVMAIIGLLMLLGGAELLVRGAVDVARHYGMSDLIIGLTIVAIGTSLPELAASLVSALRKEGDLVVGNIIGSNIFNQLAVIGLPALIYPTLLPREIVYRDFPVMFALMLLFGCAAFIRSQGNFSRGEGALLLACFIAYQACLAMYALGIFEGLFS